MCKLIEKYEDKKGQTVLEIFDTESGSYRYNGKGSLGAGCGKDLEELKNRIFTGLSTRKKNNIIKVKLA